MPHQSIISGIHAIIGICLKHVTVGWSIALILGDIPITEPSTTPTTDAARNSLITHDRLIAVQNLHIIHHSGIYVKSLSASTGAFSSPEYSCNRTKNAKSCKKTPLPAALHAYLIIGVIHAAVRSRGVGIVLLNQSVTMKLVNLVLNLAVYLLYKLIKSEYCCVCLSVKSV